MGEYNIIISRLEKMIHERPGAAIHCDSEDKAIELLRALSSLGYTWLSGHELCESTHWGDYKEKTCYAVREDQHKICFTGKGYDPAYGYEYIEFDELLDSDEYVFDQEAINEFTFKPNIAIHCDTEEKAAALLKELERHGFMWSSGEVPTKFTAWDSYKNETCYENYKSTMKICYADTNYFSRSYTIVEFDNIASEARSAGFAERFINFLGGNYD